MVINVSQSCAAGLLFAELHFFVPADHVAFKWMKSICGVTQSSIRDPLLYTDHSDYSFKSQQAECKDSCRDSVTVLEIFS